jgi:hypothetical protein
MHGIQKKKKKGLHGAHTQLRCNGPQPRKGTKDPVQGARYPMTMCGHCCVARGVFIFMFVPRMTELQGIPSLGAGTHSVPAQ